MKMKTREFLNSSDDVQSRIVEVDVNVPEENENIKLKRFIRLDCEAVIKYYVVNCESNYKKYEKIISDLSNIIDVFDEKNGVVDLKINDTHFDFYGTYVNLNNVSLISIIDFCDLLFDEVDSEDVIRNIDRQILNQMLSIKI